jgi:hypothetical protein
MIRGALLIPFILMLIAVGAFAEKNVFEDVVIVLAFGALGWVMTRVDWPRPPLLLGLVLGPLAENKLFLSTDNYGLAWLIRPGVLILFAIIVVGLVGPMVIDRRRRARSQAAPAPAPAPRRGLRLDGSTAFSVFVVLLFAWGLWEAKDFGPRAALFPLAIGLPVLVLALVQLGRDLLWRRAGATAMGHVEGAPDVPPGVARRRGTEMAAWILAYWVALWLLGFSVATLAMTLLYLKLTGRERWPITVVLSAIAFAFVYGLFEMALAVPFPSGRLYGWLGLVE